MPIIKSLLKYGHDNFALLILEYIDSEDISERETYWITKSSPYYNVLKKAYSSVPLSRCPARVGWGSDLSIPKKQKNCYQS